MCATKSPPKWTEKRAPLGALFFRVAPGGSLFKMCRKKFRFCSEPSKTHGEKNPHENERNEERPRGALLPGRSRGRSFSHIRYLIQYNKLIKKIDGKIYCKACEKFGTLFGLVGTTNHTTTIGTKTMRSIRSL